MKYRILLFAGGISELWNFRRYKNDLSMLLETLRHLEGVSADNVWLLSGAGGDVFQCGQISLTAAPATRSSLAAAISQISTRCESDDIYLFVASNHGGQSSEVAPSARLWCWNEEFVEDSEFAEWTNSISANRQVFVLGQCFSGGFLDDLASDRRLVMAACEWNKPSYATEDRNYDEFLLRFCQAIDSGLSTLDEVFDYAVAYDTRNEVPQKSDLGNLGASLQLTRSSSQLDSNGVAEIAYATSEGPADYVLNNAEVSMGKETERNQPTVTVYGVPIRDAINSGDVSRMKEAERKAEEYLANANSVSLALEELRSEIAKQGSNAPTGVLDRVFPDKPGTCVTLELPETMLSDSQVNLLKSKILASTIGFLNTMDTNIGGSCHGKVHCKMG